MSHVRERKHISVLLNEATAPFRESIGNVYVDCTLGGGGHLERLMELKPQCKFFAFDRDPAMIENAKVKFAKAIEEKRLALVHANYGDIRSRILDFGVDHVDGVLLDAGVSSFQIDEPERGFSFSKNGPLDMRMDPTESVTAYSIVNQWPQKELENIFYRYGEERFSRKIALRILEKRAREPIADTLTLAKIVEDCLPRHPGSKKAMHPATRVFQALRIAVNQELVSLEKFLEAIPEILSPGGVCSIISFHSLEDRLVKERFKYLSANCVCPPSIITCERCNRPPGFLLQKKPIIPTEAEMNANPRSRSAKLRVFVRNSVQWAGQYGKISPEDSA